MKRGGTALALLAGSWLIAGTLQAEDGIVGMLDGEAREWFILRDGEDSNASFVDLGGYYSVDLLGFVEPDSWRPQEALSIGLTVVDETVTEFEVRYLMGATAMPPVYTSEQAELELVLEAFEVQGVEARVAGQVRGTLALQERLEEAPSLERGIDIDVHFDIVARRLEF